MDLQEASTLSVIAGGFVGVGSAVWYAGRQVARAIVIGNRLAAMVEGWDPLIKRVDKVELHTQTVWEFVLRRGMAEAVQKGMATVNSPVRLRPEAIEWMAGLAVELREAYETRWKNLDDDVAVCVAIETEFGKRITMEVCLPHGITNAACLLIACAVAKGEAFVPGVAAV